jgi:hypothetical protein
MCASGEMLRNINNKVSIQSSDRSPNFPIKPCIMKSGERAPRISIYPLDRRLGGSQNWSRCCGKGKISCLCQKSNTVLAAHSHTLYWAIPAILTTSFIQVILKYGELLRQYVRNRKWKNDSVTHKNNTNYLYCQ